MIKMNRIYMALVALSLTPVAFADLESPTVVTCTVQRVAPVDAKFFGFSNPVKPGDTTVLDLSAPEIPLIKFASGAVIGSTVTPHPLISQPSSPQNVRYEAKFKSHVNGSNYEAYLVGYEIGDKKVEIGLDVLQRNMRLQLNSLDMICTR